MDRQIAAATLMRRADLIGKRVRMGGQYFWVLKDPLSRAYFYVTDREHAILSLLDGRRRLSEIVKACSTRFAPDFVSAESVANFLAEAKSSGLINVHGRSAAAANRDDTNTFSEQSGITGRTPTSNWLAFRLPGVNPDAWLESPARILQPFFTLPSAIAYAVVLCLAVIIVVTRFDHLVQDTAAATGRAGIAWWVTVAAVVGVTKVIHELAHALACKIQGAECRELGVMFLVGVPCLYCDVSDAWMLPDRAKRILVSAAGMLVELFVAAIAVFLWSVSEPGMFRDLCLTITVVCSVSTVLFNGNPLLRYDGYFILSDAIAAPNLVGESRRMIHDRCRRLIWRLPNFDSASRLTSGPSARTLISYGLLSGLYRCFVMVAIAMLGYRLLANIGLPWIGTLLVVGFLVAMVWKMLRPLIQPPDRSVRRSATGESRRWIAGLVLGGLLLLAFIPLPRQIAAPMMIQPAAGHRIYVDTPGTLVSCVESGESVEAGDVIAVLRNSEIDYRLVAQQGERDVLQTRLTSLQKRVISDVSVAGQVEVVAEQLKSAETRLDLLESQRGKLQVIAGATGSFYSPRPRIDAAQSGPVKQAKWSGVPLDDRNRGSLLQRGTHVGTIGDPGRREAVLLVPHQAITRIKTDQTVQLLLGAASQAVTGRVIAVSPTPDDDIAPELTAAGLATEETYYRVRVSIDNEAAWLAVRTTGKAQIDVDAESLYSRAKQTLRETFSVL